MQLNRRTNYASKFIKSAKTPYYNETLRNNFLKEQLSTLLSNSQNDLNKKLYFNTTLHQVQIQKRSSNCASKNGNFGRMPIYLLRIIF